MSWRQKQPNFGLPADGMNELFERWFGLTMPRPDRSNRATRSQRRPSDKCQSAGPLRMWNRASVKATAEDPGTRNSSRSYRRLVALL